MKNKSFATYIHARYEKQLSNIFFHIQSVHEEQNHLLLCIKFFLKKETVKKHIESVHEEQIIFYIYIQDMRNNYQIFSFIFKVFMKELTYSLGAAGINSLLYLYRLLQTFLCDGIS